jgi:hypothetical protein
MSTKHTATLPDNTVATRTSANRVYPFAVAVGPAPKSEIIASLAYSVKEHTGYADEAQEIIDYITNGGEIKLLGSAGWESMYATGLKPRRSRSANEARLGMRRVGLSYTEGKGTMAEQAIAFHAEILADALERAANAALKHAMAGDGPEFVGGWFVSGWQSRADLAAKERDKMSRAYPGREVTVLTATIVTK